MRRKGAETIWWNRWYSHEDYEKLKRCEHSCALIHRDYGGWLRVCRKDTLRKNDIKQCMTMAHNIGSSGCMLMLPCFVVLRLLLHKIWTISNREAILLANISTTLYCIKENIVIYKRRLRSQTGLIQKNAIEATNGRTRLEKAFSIRLFPLYIGNLSTIELAER